jgi:glutathione S-transferase
MSGAGSLTLYSYPGLFGVADNNPFGLKVYALLKLCALPFRHEHVLDASAAPRGQLPYLVDGADVIGDSDTIVAHLIARRGLTIDAALTPSQRNADLMIRRLLDDLYWVMSYSRWKDDRFWPRFRDLFVHAYPVLTVEALEGAREFNFKRYHFQGIGRYEPADAYARGIADLDALANLLPGSGYMFGAKPGSIDAAVYGFIANIYFYDIDTPLKECLMSQQSLVAHCKAIHAAL